jgi:SAM-dependent methyltransferase
MHEILRQLEPGAFVLDLGCSAGSFHANETRATTVRLDLEHSPNHPGGFFVQGDAARLPFADQTFAAVISNHSLEHIENLECALNEVRRVLRPDGALYVAVPDSTTLTDRIYRWLANGGGHVNPFREESDLVATIAGKTGLELRGTRVLYSSLSFLNERHSPRPRPLRLLLFGGGAEWTLFLFVLLSRKLDQLFGTRTSIYGWATYYGKVECMDLAPRANVCLRCGSGTPLELLQQATPRQRMLFFKTYTCPCCSAVNPLIAS